MSSQWVVTGPSRSTPAAARMNAPVNTDAVMLAPCAACAAQCRVAVHAAAVQKPRDRGASDNVMKVQHPEVLGTSEAKGIVD